VITFLEWLKHKSEKFAKKTYLIDDEEIVTYAENFKKIQFLMSQLNDIHPSSYIIFIGPGSIKSYQLYFAVIALQAIWIPFDYLLQKENLLLVLNQLKPSLIIYDKECFNLQEYRKDIPFKTIELTEIFNGSRQTLPSWEVIEGEKEFSSSIASSSSSQSQPLSQERELTVFDPFELATDRIISGYLTSGSTGKPKIVMHSWYATWYHANETVNRYRLNHSKALFNPRLLCHVSGAFPLTTYMHCGGSIVIPNKNSYKKMGQERIFEWAEQICRTPNITHISFFPSEMHAYASLVEVNPRLRPLTLERITTGGEEVEFADLIRISRAFATHRGYYDLLWRLYPILGNSWLFQFFKILYEFFYGRLVQITQTYGATELICNAVANLPQSGPDPRGIGYALNGLYPEIINEQGAILPWDGQTIGRLRFFGNSIASSYLDLPDSNLTQHYYQTSDLAAINPEGYITLFGRSENLISLSGIETLINPVVMERIIHKSCQQRVLVFEYNNTLHAAIELRDESRQQRIINSIRSNADLSLITTISFRNSFPLLPGGKIDRKLIENLVRTNETPTIDLNHIEEPPLLNRCRWLL
jgi:acyl-CoA synthetase (AMP-forming)/AMP-acid ligase II